MEWDLQALKRAKYGEMVDVKVWTKNITGKYPYLDFEMYVGKTKVAIATSKWALIDLKARQFAEATKEYMAKYRPESKETIPVASLGRINVPETFDKCVEVTIRKSDIDFNGHIHNLNYLDFIAELMDFDEEFNNLRIIYWKEIRYGNTVTVCKATIDNSLYFIIKSGEEVKTIIESQIIF